MASMAQQARTHDAYVGLHTQLSFPNQVNCWYQTLTTGNNTQSMQKSQPITQTATGPSAVK